MSAHVQADKRARQRAKEKERKDGKEAAAASNHGGSKGSSKAAAAAGGNDSFDAELAAAMAEAAAISSRCVCVCGGAVTHLISMACELLPTAQHLDPRQWFLLPLSLNS